MRLSNTLDRWTVMASDGNWVSAPATRRGVADYVKLKYYHWCLWTGSYMLDTRERAALNGIVLVLVTCSSTLSDTIARPCREEM